MKRKKKLLSHCRSSINEAAHLSGYVFYKQRSRDSNLSLGICRLDRLKKTFEAPNVSEDWVKSLQRSLGSDSKTSLKSVVLEILDFVRLRLVRNGEP